MKERNSKLFSYLDKILSVSQRKFRMEKASNATRQRWGSFDGSSHWHLCEGS